MRELKCNTRFELIDGDKCLGSSSLIGEFDMSDDAMEGDTALVIRLGMDRFLRDAFRSTTEESKKIAEGKFVGDAQIMIEVSGGVIDDFVMQKILDWSKGHRREPLLLELPREMSIRAKAVGPGAEQLARQVEIVVRDERQ